MTTGSAGRPLCGGRVMHELLGALDGIVEMDEDARHWDDVAEEGRGEERVPERTAHTGEEESDLGCSILTRQRRGVFGPKVLEHSTSASSLFLDYYDLGVCCW